jgi:hypothetical protein
MCIPIGFQITRRAEETPQQERITCNLINLWSKAYIFQVELQDGSPPWLALAAPVLVDPAMRVFAKHSISHRALFAVDHACYVLSLALPLASQVAPVPSNLQPIFQALVPQHQDSQNAHRQDVTSSFDFLPSIMVMYQAPLLMQMNHWCNLQMVHAGAFAALGHQPFLGGGQASLPPLSAQGSVRSLTPHDIAQHNSHARDLFLLMYVLQPLDEVLQQLVELRQAGKQLRASAGQGNKSSGDTVGAKVQHGK